MEFSKKGDVGKFVQITACPDKQEQLYPKTVMEYPLPGASTTHELALLSNWKGDCITDMIVISQQSNSNLVKVELDEMGRPCQARSFQVGSRWSGLHGVCRSFQHPGMIWLTLQFDSMLLLIDPGTDSTTPPEIIECIKVPSPGRGPHVIREYGDELLVTLKDSHHILKINTKNACDYKLYKTSRTPVFVAKHPISDDIYASIDISSKIARVISYTDTVEEIDVPMGSGSIPVGLVEGSDCNIWFVLNGGSNGGNGTFGKITEDGQFHWFKLPNNMGKEASLLHLAFDRVHSNSCPRLYLLSSSILKPSATNGVFDVTFDNDYSRIETVTTIALPTQFSKAHRVLHTTNGLYVTELSTSALAHISSKLGPSGHVIDDTSDYYSQFGMGARARNVVYEID